MQYRVSERFKSVQGEGAHAGCPMAFIRFVGCSVGKKVCNACDTDFEVEHSFREGGQYTALDLLLWAQSSPSCEHVCLTGGEPFDQDLIPFFLENEWAETFHVESSGTKPFVPLLEAIPDRKRLWLCMSPKPGYLEGNIELADEIKVIVPGLGSGAGWPSLKDALKWADEGKKVFLQPRNGRFEVDKVNMSIVKGLVMRYPQLRLSVQLHKILGVQ